MREVVSYVFIYRHTYITWPVHARANRDNGPNARSRDRWSRNSEQPEIGNLSFISLRRTLQRSISQTKCHCVYLISTSAPICRFSVAKSANVKEHLDQLGYFHGAGDFGMIWKLAKYPPRVLAVNTLNKLLPPLFLCRETCPLWETVLVSPSTTRPISPSLRIELLPLIELSIET